ncbi:MAG TPA: hypothetical protein VKX49_15180 [Bryobacteraceae bacterium]|nr:hypothetical protein [Bryobacteraceae bacterium]
MAQEENSGAKPEHSQSEPKYSDTFAGPIIEMFYNGDSPKRTHPDDMVTRITVSRSILGKPPEKRTFLIKPDTRIEGNLRMRARVTVGYVVTDDANVARLIVVRSSQRPAEKK